MIEHPILFSGPMVRAILDGTKTQTRRIAKGVPGGITEVRNWGSLDTYATDPGLWGFWGCEGLDVTQPHNCYDFESRCPYGVPGDHLWVRETHVFESDQGLGYEVPDHLSDGRPIRWHEDDDWGRWWEAPHYRATDPEPELAYEDTDEPTCRWRPSIHMPRWASRLLLEVTEVRVERVQDISYRDVIAEGLTRWLTDEQQTDSAHKAEAERDFSRLWDEINGKRAPWASNPWVWVVSFKRVEGDDGP